jgi:hypothetical protein
METLYCKQNCASRETKKEKTYQIFIYLSFILYESIILVRVQQRLHGKIYRIFHETLADSNLLFIRNKSHTHLIFHSLTVLSNVVFCVIFKKHTILIQS